MKYVHYDKTNGKLLGWYDDEIHGTYVPEVPAITDANGKVITKAVPAHYDISNIPKPNIAVKEADWQTAIDNNYNYVDATTKTLSYKDFSTPKELKAQARQKAKADRDKALNSITHTLADGSVFQIRPKDVPNYQLAIQLGVDTDWILADNTVRHTTIAELQEVMNSGIQQGKVIWDNYIKAIKGI